MMLSTKWMWHAGSRLDVSKHQKCEKICTCAVLIWYHDFKAQCVRPPRLMHCHALCPLIGRGFAWHTRCWHCWCNRQNDRHHHQMVPCRPGRCHWHLKVYRCVLVTFLDRTLYLIGGWFRWGSNNKHHECRCWKEIGLRFRILLSTPHSIVNPIGRTYIVK